MIEMHKQQVELDVEVWLFMQQLEII